MDSLEAFANATLGVAVSIAAVNVFWPLFGWPVTASQSVQVTALFWGLSFGRAWVLRKIFRRLG